MNRLSRKKSKQNLFIINCFLLISLLALINFFPNKGYADESNQIGKKEIPQSSTQSNQGVGFTVKPVQPQNQVDQAKGYYFLRVRPGVEQEVTLKVTSTVKEPRAISISVEEAFTNQNGAIDYGGEDYIRDKTLNNSLRDITSVSDKKVTVKNYETKEVRIRIRTPNKAFNGVKMAAICAISDESDKKNEKGLTSAFGYRVGLIVTEEEEVEYDNGISLNFLKVKPTVHQGKRVIQARLQNPEPKILDDLTVETKLRKKGINEVLRKRTTNDMRMAPNSQFEFSTNWGVDPIKPGTYVLSVKATSNEKSWRWSKEFTIGEKQAKKINEEASYTLTYPKWVPIVVIILGVLTITIIGCLYLRRKKWTEVR